MMTQKEQIEEAKHCIEVMKRIGTFHDHKIGIAKESFGGFVLSIEKGRIIIFREDNDHKTLTVEVACNKEWIEKNLKNHNLNTTHSTCVCVPKSLVIPWHSKFEKIFV